MATRLPRIWHANASERILNSTAPKLRTDSSLQKWRKIISLRLFKRLFSPRRMHERCTEIHNDLDLQPQHWEVCLPFSELKPEQEHDEIAKWTFAKKNGSYPSERRGGTIRRKVICTFLRAFYPVCKRTGAIGEECGSLMRIDVSHAE
jgi:hypothetical protein